MTADPKNASGNGLLKGIAAVAKVVGLSHHSIMVERRASNIPVAEIEGEWCSTKALIEAWQISQVKGEKPDLKKDWGPEIRAAFSPPAAAPASAKK